VNRHPKNGGANLTGLRNLIAEIERELAAAHVEIDTLPGKRAAAALQDDAEHPRA
jgi:hypothetical protein